MNRPTVRIYTSVDSYIDREMNDTEYEQYLKDVSDSEKFKAEAEAKAAQRQAIADRLGLTAEELKVLLG